MEEVGVRDEEGNLRPEFVREVETAIEKGDRTRLRQLAGDQWEADLADLIEFLKPDQRASFIAMLGKEFPAAVLSELNEQVRDEVLEEMPNEQVAKVVQDLDSDDAVYLLESMEADDQKEVLDTLPDEEREALQRSLDFPEDSAGRLMQTEFIAVPPFWSVGQTIDYMREDANLPDKFSEIFVTDPTFHVVGNVPLDRLLRSKRPVLIEDIVNTEIHPIAVTEDQEEIARNFELYDLISAPVIDENRRMVGVITVDDVVEVIQEEAQEDIHRLGGVGDEAISDTVWTTTRGRFTWLLINLGTAVLASWVISLFDATIEQMVALAVLMPIVASMGGNAGTQTMTVAVRALATRDLGRINAMRVITREMIVGLLNGLLFAVIMAAVAYFWFGSDLLGLVIGAAMVVNLLVAGLFGILIPIALDEAGIDPAIASGVFVTTVTDVVGFFAFLGLAALWLV
ncbi:MAG: magnesium transporter [Pseudomonadota bacterium]|nr:magnesium transporter [Pseudomonadota bacterium]